MKNNFWRRALALLSVAVMMLGAVPAFAQDITQVPESDSMFLKLNQVEYVDPEDEFINILMCGLDFTENKNWRGSGNKRKVESAHTDSNMIIAVNLTKREVSLISLPRDTLCYLPGIRGVYKLNCAVNCGETIPEGLEITRETASWLLGGIKIDYYAALDMDALISLANLMGGLDYDLNMTYTGHTGKRYHEGMVHLDGYGMIDYLRARKNSPIMPGMDIGRCDRNRRMFLTIYEKFMNDPSLLLTLWDEATSGRQNFYTNLDDESFAYLVQLMLTLGNETVGSYMLTGEYKLGMHHWNFTFTDQPHRQSVLERVYGIKAEELPQVSYNFTRWLYDTGFPVGRQIIIAKEILDYGYAKEDLSQRQKEALDALQEAYLTTVQAYDAYAADTDNDKLKSALTKARGTMRTRGEEAAKRLGKFVDVAWNTSIYWYTDPRVNTFSKIDWN